MLIEIRQLTPRTRLGIWRMDEPQTGSPRQYERQCVQMLLTAMMDGDTSYAIGHEHNGKPFIIAGGEPQYRWNISVSHTRGFAVVLLSDECRVGVDIEYRSDRVERIAKRFIRPDEPADNIDEMLLLWSAKEAVYKLFSEDKLAFFDMRAVSSTDNVISVENVRKKRIVAVGYEFSADYVLTFVVDPYHPSTS